MTTTQTTPTPWIQRGESVVANRPVLGAYNETSVFSLERAPEERLANAAFIVQACNAHDELVEALTTASIGAIAIDIDAVVGYGNLPEEIREKIESALMRQSEYVREICSAALAKVRPS